MANFPAQAELGLFLPTTAALDVARVYDTEFNAEGMRELLVRLYQLSNQQNMAINAKDTGYYTLTEFVNGQLWFPEVGSPQTSNQSQVYRNIFRLVIDFGALPNNTTTSVAHGLTITSGFRFTRIYGTASDPSTSFIPLPYSSPTLNENISLSVDATNVTITTAIDYSGYTTTYVVLEYIKN